MKFENLSELRLLVALARDGSLSAAARALQVSPAAASAALKKLEARAGTRLVERSTRALRLTADGERLLGYAQRALELLDEAGAQLDEGRARLHGLIRVTGSSDLTRRVLLPWLDEFLALHPGVSLQLRVSDRLQDVVRDEMDLALRYGELPDSQLVARRLAGTRRIACAAPDYLARHGVPRHPSELAQHECLTFRLHHRRESAWRFWPREAPQGEPLAVRVAGRRHCDDAEIAHRWALAGFGIVCKSALDLHESLREGRLVRLFPDHLGEPVPLHAVMPGRRFLPQRVRALVEHLAARLAAVELPD